MVGLYDIQATRPIDRPLDDMAPEVCRKTIDQICDKAISQLGLPRDTSSETVQDLQNEVSAALGSATVVKKLIAFGDFSVIFSASQKKRPVAVKVVVPTMRRMWISSDFIERDERLQAIDDPRFIKII
jgi:hypothetical protein